MSGIADTFAGRLRFSPKDGIAEVGTGAVAGQSQARKESCQGGATQDTSDALQGLAACGTCRQGFGQVVKAR